MASQPLGPPQVSTVRELLMRSRDQLAAALPEHISADHYVRVAITEVQRTPKLLECSLRSLVGALFQVAQLGLTVDSTLGHAYLVPFKGIVTLIVGYKGFVQLVMRSGRVTNVEARVVRKGDEFEYRYGTDSFLHHTPKMGGKYVDGPEGALAVYALANMKGGGSHFTVMSIPEIEARAKRSAAVAAGKNTPWATDWSAMARKTPVRELAKWLPMSADYLQTAVAIDERTEAGVRTDFSALAPGDVAPAGELSTGGTDSVLEGLAEDLHRVNEEKVTASVERQTRRKRERAAPPQE